MAAATNVVARMIMKQTVCFNLLMRLSLTPPFVLELDASTRVPLHVVCFGYPLSYRPSSETKIASNEEGMTAMTACKEREHQSSGVTPNAFWG